ncbi:putative polyglutamine synthesis accessory protein [Mycobacterium talmoniae]|uniref:Putative polyglutamine synthesis accessory protein n=1 Tax=Mycobacterium talmoniae TaxID=1858794 RepID=A0A2S8BHZ4_9MYCO|nr:CapA family protein [Mycobacterium eburneum]PQM46236.1 putative polyglutamine synthesis accessory protein [Mycobacterium talmoniae]TDH50914.1 CapA family protein [Mycobacterium eburneum]
MSDTELVLFLCGDVMTGRGVDQILPHPGDPRLREPVVSDARTYVKLARDANGPIPWPTDFAWPWGEALPTIDEAAPDVRLINLETSITARGAFAPHKHVHYRMHPDNIACLAAIRPDACALANNHVLDFGPAGLADTLTALNAAGIRGVGAGLTAEQAERPATVPRPDGGQVVIAARGLQSSGIPRGWAATEHGPGVALVKDFSDRHAAEVAHRVLAYKRPGDTVIVSLHWGSNWGYEIDAAQVRFAHRLIDAGVDLVHGHSSHHPRPIEVYRGRLILYGCGDTVDDYEGIEGFDTFRPALRLLYFATVDRDSGNLITLRMTPMRARRMRLERVGGDDVAWLRSTLDHVSQPFGTRIQDTSDGNLTVNAQ